MGGRGIGSEEAENFTEGERRSDGQTTKGTVFD